MRALSIMHAIIEVCSRTPEIFGVNPFWIYISINLFLPRKEKIESRRHEVKTIRVTDSRVIGLRFAGSSPVPFLGNRTVQDFFHSDGTRPDPQKMRIILVKDVLRHGHLSKQMMGISSK